MEIKTIDFRIFENIGTSIGFVGCIKKLKIGRHVVQLKHQHDSIVQKVHDVKECAELVKCENNTNLCNCLGNGILLRSYIGSLIE